MDDQTPKPRRSFLFYGCLAGLVLMLMVVFGGLFGLYYAKKMFRDFTDTQPMALPQVQMSRAQIDQIEQRIFPKLRGVEPDLAQNALQDIGKVIGQLQDDALIAAFQASWGNQPTFLFRGVVTLCQQVIQTAEGAAGGVQVTGRVGDALLDVLPFQHRLSVLPQHPLYRQAEVAHPLA